MIKAKDAASNVHRRAGLRRSRLRACDPGPKGGGDSLVLLCFEATGCDAAAG
ncbi:MAG: hypothetical protein ABL882_02360 [Sphingopyxis sp.]